MGLLSKLFGNKKTNPELKDQRKAECPYCHKPLTKVPGSKTKCPFCNNFMYIRTRPKDSARLVVTKDEADKIDEDWTIVAGTHDDFIKDKAEYEREKEILRKKFGKEPAEGDIKWGILNKRLLECMSKQEWGLYTNTKLSMADQLRKEMRFKNALEMYLEICYLDLNGPNNIVVGINNPELLKEFPAFDPKTGFLAPGIIDYIKIIAKKLNISNSDLKEIYLKRVHKVYDHFKLPVNIEESWIKLSEELEKNIK